MDALLPCPFCGGVDLEIDHAPTYNTIHPDVYRVHCCDCGADGSEEWTEATAVVAWDTRYPADMDAKPMTEENMRKRGWVKERTCHDFNASAREHGAYLFMWRCSNCGESYGTEMDKPNYCPNCGAKVIGGSE